MKSVAVAVSAFTWALALAAPALPTRLPPPSPQQSPGLRQVLEQYHPGGGAAPRQLTPAERAELRRQLSEYGQPAPAPLPLPLAPPAPQR